MLLKFTKTSGAGTGAAGSSSSTSATFIARGTGMRMTMSTASTMTARIQRKGFRTPSKRHPGKALPGKLHSISRIGPGKLVPGKRIPQRPHPPPCDNSNDSGFGFDQHVEVPQQQQQAQQQQQQQQLQSSTSISSNNSSSSSSNSSSSSGSSSTSTNLSNNNNSHHHHNQNHHHSHHNHHHSPTAVQHSPQQHLIRAIPASRSTAVKKLPYTTTNEDDDEDFCTDDSNDFYGNLNLCSTNNLSNAGATAAPTILLTSSSSSSSSHSRYDLDDGHSLAKRKKHETHVELDNDDACSEDAFIRKIAEQQMPPMPTVAPPVIMAPTKFISNRSMARVANKRQPATPLNSVATSSNGRVQLEIVSQPEQQHRARYQTEGSRGAVKDRSGNGFPIVRLIGYNKQAVLQVFIGTDIGRVAPHMFYQACKVAGKNSTQCNEKKVDGTMVIEIDFKPETEMTITCDCVGILKERNVDVEHRFPDHLAQKNKKKSTRCRMVFRTQLAHEDGTMEMLQVCSNPIICTQPPGVPEICKKSLNSCPVDGGLELFIIGKNFLKDTHVIFQETYESSNPDDPTSEIAVRQQMGGALWEQTVLPDKEYLQQTHLICTVPPYLNQNIVKPVTVQVSIISSGKKSESHSFAYTPKGSYTALAAATTLSSSLHGSLSAAQDGNTFMDTSDSLAGASLWPASEAKHEIDSGMMPPPISTQIPMGVRRPSLPTNATPMITDQQLAHLNAVAAEALKTELLDETSQNSMVDSMHSPEATNPCDPHSPTAMQYHSRYGRKASMEAMMYDSNSMPSFPVTPATAAAAAAEVAAVVEMAAAVEMAGIAKDILLNAAVAQQQQQQQATIDKFIADQTSAAFGVDNSAAIDHALTNILQQASNAQQTAVLERSLSLSSNSSSHSSGSDSPLSGGGGATGSSPNNSLNGHSSPITQDIILNSEPAAALSALPIQQLLPHPGASNSTSVDVGGGVIAQPTATAGLSADIIMNPAVSPSTILCSANGAATAVVPNIMAPHQVTMANSILNDIAMQPQPTQQDAAVAALALSNIIMSPTTTTGGVNDVDVNVAAPPAAVQPVTAATSTAVSNMIIKAAADFISNQEQQTHHQHHHHHHQQQQQQQNHHHQQQQQHHHHQQQLMNHASSSPTTTTAPLVNLLLNHPDVGPTAAAAAAASVASAAELSQPQFPMGIAPATQQEPLIVALATENALQKSVAAAAVTTNGAVVTQQTASTTAGIHTTGTVSAAVVPLPPPIPQELTSMSDQDLISYINPSTFDQI